MVITTILLIVWAGYVNYRDVAIEKNATIMADLILYFRDMVLLQIIISTES
jgi:hypothetical protein